ncbi:MAG: RNA-binding protein [Candidatus Methanomethylicota archaeon]|uniref:Exosome complex component Rrp42 n=1 Tax=Thermoproteota archaeon TaxID=2056631 RepID=A0A497EVL1_9CREN|nr:MAG: RNA-binding protein [Candidatus Verstraetearchaeota archaeon]
MVTKVTATLNKNYMLELVSKGMRIDGRGLKDFRKVSIEFGVAGKADGSAGVKIGSTYVMVGVKAEIGKPFPDTPNEGVLMVNAEFVPLASPSFEPGPPDENAIELARVVDRGIRKSEAIDLKKLCIIPGEKVWILWVDIYVLDHNGNLMDAASLASLAALMNTKIPEVKIEDDQVIKTENRYPLELRDYPLSITIGKLGSALLVDPSLEEEEVLDSKLTIFLSQDDKICAMQKAFPGIFTPEEILMAVDLARDKSRELRKILFDTFEKYNESRKEG